MSSSNNSANNNSPSGNPPGMGSPNNSYVFQQIFISIIVLSSIFIIICVIRWILLRVSTRRTSFPSSSSLPITKRNTDGLDSSAIAALPTFPYKKELVNNKEVNEENNNVSAMDCSICLSAVEEGEIVKLLPVCMHSFHGECVDLWLSAHSTCPVCRAEVIVDSTSGVQWEQNLNRVDRAVVVVPVVDDIERQLP